MRTEIVNAAVPLTRTFFWVLLDRRWRSYLKTLQVFQPDMLVLWHRKGFRFFWRWKSRRGRGGRLEVASTCERMWQSHSMTLDKTMYSGYRFSSEIIAHSVWLYHRFALSFRDVEDLLAERSVVVSYETIRIWCTKFEPQYARAIKKRRGCLGDTWFLNEIYCTTARGERCYLWRTVDQDGDLLEILVQKHKDKQAAIRFFRKIMKGQGRSPRLLVTDKLPSYGVGRKALIPGSLHCDQRYANNRCEVSNEPIREQERQMRCFKSTGHAIRFLTVHGRIKNLFGVGRHLVRAVHHRILRDQAICHWGQVTCVN